MSSAIVEVEAGRDVALLRAREHLLSLQHPEGWWKGELETNVTMDAEDLMLREFLGIAQDGVIRALRRVDPLTAERRRLVEQVLRRPGRSVDDGGGVRRAAAGR